MNKNTAGKLRFVVQKHQSKALHYDFRLEIGGKMPSWAIPKGPTLDNTVKRLAVRTSDHEMDWRNFEGVIPEGEYGAGAVMIWDEGAFHPQREITRGVRKDIFDPKEAERVLEEELEKGDVKFVLNGNKLHGSFALVKTRGFGKSKQDTWLLIKHKDEYSEAGYDAKNFDFSVRTNRSISEITEYGHV